MPLYDFECEVCGNIEEKIARPEEEFLPCSKCSSQAKKRFTGFRKHIDFPEGTWDIGGKEVHISSRRQLKEVMERHNSNPDHTKHSYAKYLDGYRGY